MAVHGPAYVRLSIADVKLTTAALTLLEVLPADKWLTRDEWLARAEMGQATFYRHKPHIEQFIETGTCPGDGPTDHQYRLAVDGIQLSLTDDV